ncbi:MAG: nuclear transport factor 2 family protein [Gammaproteobacteria bacterium]|nr:nuclear transport factor 2 family protein [Gammaproteobacteria bacterium]MDE0365754.1 nuclear transport factor 2 family protein [Gammaproteobacteria bacterium]
MTPEQALAREAIRHTMSIYNTEGDRGRLEGLASAFLEDGVLETGSGTFRGRAAIVEGLGTGIAKRAGDPERGVGFVRHNLTTSRIEFVSDSEARCWTYFIVYTRFGPDHMGTYVDRFSKSGERWLIANRRVKLHWNNPASTYHDG